MAAATLISRSGGSTWVNGFIQYDLTHTYQVLADRNSSIVTILNWPGIPAAGSTAILGGATVWVGRPQVTQPNPDVDRFIVTVPYGNLTSQFERDQNGNPVSDPTKAVKRVTIDYSDEPEPVTNARLRKITYQRPEWDPLAVTRATPDWLPEWGPVTNSAGEPIHLERTKRVKQITVQRVERNWSNTWDDYQNAINSDTVTIEVRDSDGLRATHTFKPYTLKMVIRTPEEWKDAKLYFRPTFIMDHNTETWVHAEVDRGTKRRASLSQYNPDTGSLYTPAELNAKNINGEYGFTSIMTDGDTVAIGEPVLFNGTGAEQPTARTDGLTPTGEMEPYFLNYDIETNIRPFSVLKL